MQFESDEITIVKKKLYFETSKLNLIPVIFKILQKYLHMLVRQENLPEN
jgi:hypothetical protein